MTVRGPAILHQLQSVARARKMTTDHLLKRWVGERFLARVSCSPYSRQLVLKGGNLFVLWTGDLYRGTWDIDLHAEEADSPGMRDVLPQVLAVAINVNDGLRFDPADVRIKDLVGSRIPGLRMQAVARLASARVHLKVDVGFGHPISPGTEIGWYPSLLPDYSAFAVHACPRETLIAEKLAVMVEFGRDNTRLRDYYDLWFLSRNHNFYGHKLLDALGKTFASRDAGALLQRSDGYWEASLEQGFATSSLERNWRNWLLERAPALPPPPLTQVVEQVARFGLPLLTALKASKEFEQVWRPALGWLPLYVHKHTTLEDRSAPTSDATILTYPGACSASRQQTSSSLAERSQTDQRTRSSDPTPNP